MRLTAGVMFVLLLLASAAWGQPGPTGGKEDGGDREQARAHANAGRELFDRGQYADAIARFEQAEAIIHAPPHWLYIARAHDKQGQLLRARESYQKLVAEPIARDTPDAFKRAVEQGKSELSALQARIPRLTVRIAGPDRARATVDGGAVEVGAATEIDPGEHTVPAESDGWVSASQKVNVAESESRELTLTLGAAIAAPPEPEEVADDAGVPIVPIVILGVGVVGLGIGTVTGIMALGKADELKEICADLDPCPSQHEALKDDAESLATVSTVSLIVGGALAAGGGAWLLVELLSGGASAEGHSAEGHVVPWLGPGVGGVAGRF